MIWAMGALVVILILLVATGNLRLMIGFLAVALVVITLLLVFDVFEERRSANLIPPQEIELIGFRMQHGHASVYELSGRVQNHSPQFGLFRLSLRVLALDCPDAQAARSDCAVIGEQLERLSVDVPAGQARDVNDRVRFADAPMKLRGVLRWEFEVAATGSG